MESRPGCQLQTWHRAAFTHENQPQQLPRIQTLMHLHLFTAALGILCICGYLLDSFRAREASPRSHICSSRSLLPHTHIPHHCNSVNYRVWTFKRPIKGHIWVCTTQSVHIITCFGPRKCRRVQRDRNTEKMALRESERWSVSQAGSKNKPVENLVTKKKVDQGKRNCKK